MSGTAFFPEKSCSLSLGFFKLSLEECTLGVTNPWNGCCKCTPPWISQNKKFLYKLIFRGYKIFRRIPEEFYSYFFLFLSDNHNSFYNNEVI